MSIKNFCQTKVITVGRNSTLKDVAVMMQKHHVGCVIVTEGMDGKRVPAGLVTDRDLALALGATLNPQDLKVEQIMYSHPATISCDDHFSNAAKKMRELAVRRLPVVNADGSLFGLLSLDDLLRIIGEEVHAISQISDRQIKNEQGIKLPKETHIQL